MELNYDEEYRAGRRPFGEKPWAAVRRFFEALPRRPLRVLDLGCGYGRNAVAIAAFGHTVFAADRLISGVCQMVESARVAGVSVNGFVADALNLGVRAQFDIVLMDYLLHVLPPGGRRAMLQKAARLVRRGGVLLVIDELYSVRTTAEMLARAGWSVTLDHNNLIIAEDARGTVSGTYL